MRCFISKAGLDDILSVSSRLRPEDRRELETAHGRPARSILIQSWQASRETFVIRFSPVAPPVVLFGIVTAEPNILGVPWMVATPEVSQGAHSILREARKWFEYWLHRYDMLMNVVELRNKLHVRWLLALGCHFGKPYKRRGVEVIPFFY